MTNKETAAAASGEIIGEAGWPRLTRQIVTAGYVMAAMALLAWGAWKRFQLPQAPIIDPDVKGYLGPAIGVLAGKPFAHMIGRSFPYPGFVCLILRIFGDFRAICVVQHLLGIVAGGLVLAAWNAAGALVPPGGIPKPVFRYLGLVPAYVCLGSATGISFEHQIRPEAIFPFLGILNIWVSILFLDTAFVRPKPSFVWLGSLNVFISFLMYMAKPSFGFATIFCTLPVWISLALPGRPFRTKGVLAAGAILPALLLLWLPEHLLKKGDEMAESFLPETLFTVHAALVEQQMTEDLAGNEPLPYGRDVVQAAHDLLGAELNKAAHITTGKTYPSLGYSPDYLMYRDSFCVRFPGEVHFTSKEMADFCMAYYLRTLRHHPGEMAAKVKRQLAIFYAVRNPAYRTASLELSEAEYARVATVIQTTSEIWPACPALQRYVDNCAELAGRGIVIPEGKSFMDWTRTFAALYLELLGVALLSPLLLIGRRLRAHLAWLVAAVWLAFSYNFGTCLTIAIVHSLEVARYVRIQLLFTVFAESLSIGLVLELVVYQLRAARARGAGGTISPEESGSK